MAADPAANFLFKKLLQLGKLHEILREDFAGSTDIILYGGVGV